MTGKMVMEVFRVDVWEFERGWGSKLDFSVYFQEHSNAEQYVQDFNSKNTESTVPDWYMVAYKPVVDHIDPDSTVLHDRDNAAGVKTCNNLREATTGETITVEVPNVDAESVLARGKMQTAMREHGRNFARFWKKWREQFNEHTKY